MGARDNPAPNLGRQDVRVSPLAGRTSEPPACGRGRPVALARGVDAPAGVSATAAPDRSPRPPGLRYPRRGMRLHRILIAPGPRRPPRSLQTPRLFARGRWGWESAAGGGGGPRGRASSPLSPSRSASAGREFEALVAERIPPLPLRFWVGGRRQAGAGAGDSGIGELEPAPPARAVETDPQGLGNPRAPEVCSFFFRRLRLLSLSLRTWDPVQIPEPGWGPEPPDANAVNTERPSWIRSQKGLGHQYVPLRPEPLVSGLSGDHTCPLLNDRFSEEFPTACFAVFSRESRGQAWQGAGCGHVEGLGREPHYPTPMTARPWRRRPRTSPAQRNPRPAPAPEGRNHPSGQPLASTFERALRP